MTQTSASPTRQQTPDWLAFVTLTVLTAYFHVFMEWLFFVTKSSSLSTLSLYEKSKVFIVSGGVLALILLAGLAVLSIPAWLVTNPKWKTRLSALRFIPSVFMLSVTALILIDNFTYTVTKFGIVSVFSAWRAIYILIFILIFRWMFRFVQRTVRTLNKPASFTALGLLALSIVGILSIYTSRAPYLNGFNISLLQPSDKRPNIIIIGADGLSDSYLSVYGYDEETTPFLTELAKTSLVAENGFPNSSSTTGSTASALTGKEPIEVDVYRYPDILTGEDSFEHLPGILKSQGYRTVEIGTPYYVDAKQLNMIDAFDIVNNESMKQPALDALRSVLGNSSSTYFTQTITERAAERLLHIFFIRDMENPLEIVNNPKVRMTDTQRMGEIISLLEESDRPLFVFAHFMDTHGPLFSSEKDVAAKGKFDKEAEWDVELYKDSIKSFDSNVKKIYSYLEQSGKLDNTILVIYTDHGYKYVVNQRIPIIVHFPKDEHSGSRKNNVEIIDIPVTLLDYLGISQPEWMRGTSILSDEPPANRKIISITGGSPKKTVPPFYQIKTVQVLVCQKWYSLNVQDNIWKSGLVKGHTGPCAENTLPSDAEIRQMILDYLNRHGYDTSSFPPFQ